MARRTSSAKPAGVEAEPLGFAFLGFREGWYVLRGGSGKAQPMLAFEAQVTDWLVNQRITPGSWAHFGRGNTGEYPAVPDDENLYLLVKRPADVLRCAARFPCTGIGPATLLAAVQAEARVHRFVVEDMARIAHEAVCRLVQTFGDTAVAWDDLGGETRVAFVLQVQRRLENPDESVQQEHQAWIDQRTRDGWRYGARFSVSSRSDPLLVPWKNLSQRVQARYRLVAATITALAPLLA